MPLDESYLVYPRRMYGADHPRFAWRTPDTRAPVTWPDGHAAACMIVVPIEHHPLDPTAKPFKHPGAMVTPYPDLRHYTGRDYGNRVGVYRILDALDRAGLKATFPVNAMSLERFAPLVEAIADGGHEIAAYGLATDRIHWGGLDRAAEEQWVFEVRQRFAAAGLTPRTWLSPARQQSFATLDLIRSAGFDICLDWESDTVPLEMKTDGGTVLSLSLSNELDDRTLLIDRRQTEEEWIAQLIEAVAYTASEEPRRGGQMIGFTLTPYVAGQPFRIAALRGLLTSLVRDQTVWCATAMQIATHTASSAVA